MLQILGRPFLATGRTFIDVQGGKLTMRVNEEQVVFNIYPTKKSSEKVKTCHMVQSIDEMKGKNCKRKLFHDSLEQYMATSYSKIVTATTKSYTQGPRK